MRRLQFQALVILAVLFSLAYASDPPSVARAAEEQDSPSSAALAAGLAARQRHAAQVTDDTRWTLIDYDLPFTAVRMWVLDARHAHALLASSRVSHAWNSGLLFATKFSNVSGSELSSLGSYVTDARPYNGRFGRSLRVRGLDRGHNDHARQRAIIFHPDLGLTHSAGCFMLPDAEAAPLIDRIAGGTFVYVHGPRS